MDIIGLQLNLISGQYSDEQTVTEQKRLFVP